MTATKANTEIESQAIHDTSGVSAIDPKSIDIKSIDEKSGVENFPVALRLLPKKCRTQLQAFYRFARLVDDLGDEYEGDRLAALDWAEEQIKNPTHAIFVDLLECSFVNTDSPPEPSSCDPKENLLKLIAANRLDQEKTRYQSYAELYEYCELSANPVGRIVLQIFGAASPELVQHSNSVSTGLQILEHLQDMGEDYEQGRIYIPLSELERHGVAEGDLSGESTAPELQRLVLDSLKKVEELLGKGDLLVANLKGWAKLAVAGYVAGGKVATNALLASGGDILAGSTGRRTSGLRRIYHILRLTIKRKPKMRGEVS